LPDRSGIAAPNHQIAWAKLRAARQRGDREQGIVELNLKVPVGDERN
jgi:hypothetical protein